jgi:hypothetical protein
MRCSTLTKISTALLIFLGSYSPFSPAQDISVKTVTLPAWNIITSTLLKMTPLVNGKRDNTVMAQICGLARGQKSQQEVNDFLVSNKIKVASLSTEGGTLSLLVNGNKVQQQSACTAYLASSLFTPVDTTVYMRDEVKTEDKSKASKKDSTATKSEGSHKVFDQAQFVQDMRVQIALAQATAQMYAVIASNLAEDKGLSWGEYQSKIQQLVSDYAAIYLQSEVSFYTNLAQQPITIQALNTGGYRVADNVGHELIRNGSSLLFRSLDVDWLGAGKIFGQNSVVRVTIIDSVVKHNNSAEKKERKTHHKK